MAVFELPIRSDVTNYDFEVELDGEVFVLRLYLNSRDEFWYLDLRSESGEPLMLGRRVVVESPLTQRIRDKTLPAGEIALTDLTQQDLEATEASFGVDHLLLYLDAAELALIAAGG